MHSDPENIATICKCDQKLLLLYILYIIAVIAEVSLVVCGEEEARVPPFTGSSPLRCARDV